MRESRIVPIANLAVRFPHIANRPISIAYRPSPMTIFTARECLQTLGLAAVATRFPQRGLAAPGKSMRGVFIILNTPFTAAGEVDWDDLEREVAFVDRGGCSGIVWPQGSSSVATLTKEERLHGMEVLAKAATGRRGWRSCSACRGRTPRRCSSTRKRADALGDRRGHRDAADDRQVDGRLPRLLPCARRLRRRGR